MVIEWRQVSRCVCGGEDPTLIETNDCVSVLHSLFILEMNEAAVSSLCFITFVNLDYRYQVFLHC